MSEGALVRKVKALKWSQRDISTSSGVSRYNFLWTVNSEGMSGHFHRHTEVRQRKVLNLLADKLPEVSLELFIDTCLVSLQCYLFTTTADVTLDILSWPHFQYKAFSDLKQCPFLRNPSLRLFFTDYSTSPDTAEITIFPASNIWLNSFQTAFKNAFESFSWLNREGSCNQNMRKTDSQSWETVCLWRNGNYVEDDTHTHKHTHMVLH